MQSAFADGNDMIDFIPLWAVSVKLFYGLTICINRSLIAKVSTVISTYFTNTRSDCG